MKYDYTYRREEKSGILILTCIMEILQLKYFCSAAETENFALTARKFFVPPASVSQCIRRLEEELGRSLFDRKPNGVKLNKFGKNFYITASSSL